MAPVDWDVIMTTNINDVEDDVEKWYEEFAELDLDEEDDVAHLHKAFRLAQAVMNVKAASETIALEELQKTVASGAKKDAKKENDLLRQIADLEQQVKDAKRYGGDMASGGSTANTRVLREEIRELERDCEMHKREIKALERELAADRTKSDTLTQKLRENEEEMHDMKRESDRLHDDIADYKRQLESQRENMLMKRGDDVENRDKIQRKNRELLDALQEIENLTAENNKLNDDANEMRKNLTDAVHQMEMTTDQYNRLKAVLAQSDAVLDSCKLENEQLKIQVQDLTEQTKCKTDTDDELMVAVNKKVEEWKAILTDKEDEIGEYREHIGQLKQQLLAANMDQDKASVTVLTQAVEKRDKQIELLSQQLESATSDIETQTAVIEDLRTELNRDIGTGGPNQRQQQKIKELQGAVKFHDGQAKDAESRMMQAEEDAKAKDKELNEALERMKKFEAGEYGLAEAVTEIKEHKQGMSVRDRQIEELTQHVNKCEMQMNEVMEENEDLRDRLGLDPKQPVDLTMHRENKKVQHQQDRALNQVLQKEVEHLEEERIELKKKIRLLAQQAGQRAVALGLTADDIVAIDEFTEGLKDNNKAVDQPSRTIKKDAAEDELRLRNMELDKDLEKNVKDLDRLRSMNVQLKSETKQLAEENKNLEKGMKEILTAIKEQKNEGAGSGQAHNIECPTLERMLAAIEAKAVSGNYDGLHLKSQVDNLQGRTEELRRELREARHETNKAKLEADKLKTRNEKLEEDMKAMRDAGTGTGLFQSLRLPEGMAVSSADVISSLNEHLVLVLQEVTLKEDTLKKMETALENYKRKFAVVRHQQGLLYHDYVQDKKEWEEEKTKLEQKVKETEGSRQEDKVRLQELDRLLDSLGQDDVEVRRRLSEMTRKITVLRVNEKALTRRYNIMQETEGQVRKENNKFKNETIAMETAVTERLGYLQRFKDMAAFKIAALQKSLDDCVPASELEAANKQYHVLTEKYRDMLVKSNTVVAETEFNAALEIEVKKLKTENEDLKKEMVLEKEKLHTFEIAMENLGRQGIGVGKAMTDSEVISISKKITTLEMKEINERQRAEHATRLYTQQKQTMRELEERNLELEQKFSEVTKMNLEAQKVERDLRDELANCVTKAVSDTDRKRLAEVEESEAKLLHENARLKEIAEVGTMQAQSLEAQQVSREKELMSLRQQLVDFQAQSDEKKIIGKLHRHIVQLQVSEGTAVQKLEQAKKQISKLNAQLLRTQQRLDEKDQTVYHNRNEANSKSRHLKRTIHELRRQFSGAVPLSKQEKFARAMMQLQEDKHKIAKDLQQVSEEREQVTDKLAQIELQHKSLQDLLVTLKDGKGAQKVVEWHSKMEGLRLEELKRKRQITRLQEQVKFLEGMVRNHENTIATMEEENVMLEKGYEERQLQWEQREVELERIIAGMEKQQLEIAGAASKFEEAAGTLPDPSLPIANQLETAIAMIKNNIRVILETQAESKTLKRKIEALQGTLRDSETSLISRDKVIAELRMRLPATAERDEMILKATSHATAAAKEEDYETTQALKIAQSTISSLQARVQQKEETVQKYIELLKHTREDMQELNRKHEQELSLMQGKLHAKNDAAFSKFRETALGLVHKPQTPTPTNKQLTRLNELEETVAEQDNAMAMLTDKLRQAHHETDIWKKSMRS